MIIHLIAGSKGGIGKTRCAISIALYYLFSKKKSINIYDANFSNIDFFTILTGKTNIMKNDLYYKTKLQPIMMNEKGERKLKKFDSNAYVRKFPFEMYKGANDFWENICNVAEKTKKDGKEILIIDTNLAIANLISANENTWPELEEIFQQIQQHGVTHIMLWYVWCLNDFLGIRNDLNLTISTMMEDLKDRSAGLFSVQSNLIHILNPHLFFEEKRKGFLEFLRELLADTNVQTAATTLGKMTGDVTGLPFDVAVKMIFSALQIVINNKPDPTLTADEEIASIIKQLEDLNKLRLNMVVLQKDKENEFYTKELLMENSKPKNASNEELFVKYEDLHKNKFGENTLWEKIINLETYILGK